MEIRGRELSRFRKQLLGWFRKFQRDLPWRRTRDPYRIWLSEIMLQQTRVAAVIPYYERFLASFPDLRALAAAPEEKVLQLWSGLGYYSRGRNLRQAAQVLVEKHGGDFPRTAAEALELPGIGAYTAAAISSIAFGARHAVLDGNVARVLARLFAVRGDLRRPAQWKKLQETADALLDTRSPGDWNQAMMELGAMVCTPRAPQCLLCPVAKTCRARQLGIAASLPEKRKLRPREEITLAAAVLIDARGQTLLLPPPQPATKGNPDESVTSLLSNLWHFPTIRVRTNPQQELQNCLAASWSLIPNGSPFTVLRKVRHTVTYRNIALLPFRLTVKRFPLLSGARVVPLRDLVLNDSVAVSNLTRKVAKMVLASTKPSAGE